LKPDHSATREALLAQLAAQGDRDAFGELVRRALPFVRSLLRRMGAQPALADDMVQDAFLAAFRSMRTFRSEAPFANWVGRIAARLFVRRARRERRWIGMDAVLEELREPAALDATAQRLDLDSALQCLSESERLCVTMCHGAGFTHEELALELGLPLGTVKSHVTRGTRKLRLHLAEVPSAMDGSKRHE
jgi:RNA polymerase sigma factor (sigma-70 family)